MADSRPRRQRRGSRITINDIQRAAQIEINRQIDITSENIWTVGLPGDRTAQSVRDMVDNARFRLDAQLREPMRFYAPGDPLDWPEVNVTNLPPLSPRCPDINDRLCCKVIDANEINLSLTMLMESYHQSLSDPTIYGNHEPDYLWVGGLTYVAVRRIIEEMIPNRVITRITGDFGIRFYNAQVMPDHTIPNGEIMFIHENRDLRILDVRLINIGIDHQEA